MNKNFDIPDELVDAAATERLLVVVGAGASRQAKPKDKAPPSWEGLLEHLEQLATTKLRDDGKDAEARRLASRDKSDPTLHASRVVSTLGRDTTIKALIEKCSPDVEPGPIHAALANLPAGTMFATTNYDLLLDRALAKRRPGTGTAIYADDHAGIANLRGGQILKLHGDIENPESIVLTREDYKEVEYGIDAAAAWKALEAIVLRDHVLFVGSSYGDPDVRNVVDRLQVVFKGRNRKPRWLGRRDDPNIDVMKSALGLAPIVLDSFDDIGPWLRALARKAREHDSVSVAPSLVTMANRRADDELGRAQQLLDDGDYVAALNDFQALVVELGSDDFIDSKLRRRHGAARFGVVRCHMNLQDVESAEKALNDLIDDGLVDDLDTDDRASVAIMLSRLGRFDQARDLIANDPEEKSRIARQAIRLEENPRPDAIPEDLVDHPLLQSRAARIEIQEGEIDAAARRLSRFFDLDDIAHLVHCDALMLCIEVIAQTSYPFPTTKTVARVEDRRRLVTILDSALMPTIRHRATPVAARRDMLGQALRYGYHTSDTGLVVDARKLLVESGSDTPEDLRISSDDDDIERLAEQPIDRPWQRSFVKALRIIRQGNIRRAIEILEATLPEATDEPFVRTWLADLLIAQDDFAAALPHARRAFDLLPGRGQRYAVGRCQLELDRPADAATTLRPLRDSSVALWSADLARALSRSGNKEEALFVASSLLENRQRDPRLRLSVARLEFELGRKNKAADTASEAVDDLGEEMGIDDLMYAAALIRASTADNRRARTKTVVDLARRRFPDHHRTHALRVAMARDVPLDDAIPIDVLERMREDGLIVRLTPDELPRFAHTMTVVKQSAFDQYLDGRRAWPSLRDDFGYTLRDIIRRLELDEQPPIATPVRLEPVDVPDDATEVLTGFFELHLLAWLGHLDDLEKWLKSGRQLVMLEPDYLRHVHDAAFVDPGEHDEALSRCTEIERRLNELSPAGETDDLESKNANGTAFLTFTPRADRATITLATCIRRIRDAADVAIDYGDKLVEMKPPSADPQPEWPRQIVVGLDVLTADLPDDFFSRLASVVERLVISNETRAATRAYIDGLRADVRSHEVFDDVSKWVAKQLSANRIDLAAPARDDNLPAARSPDGEATRNTIEELLAPRLLLEDRPACVLLTADHLTATLIDAAITPEWIAALEWTPEGVAALKCRLTAVRDQVVDFDKFVKRIASSRLPEQTERLAFCGFLDALDDDLITDLDARYTTIRRGRPSRVIRHAAAASSRLGHLNREIANYRVGHAFREAVWNATKETTSDNDLEAFVGDTLTAVSLLDDVLHRPLELTLTLLICKTLDNPVDAFVAAGSQWTTSSRSRISRIWRYVRSWMGNSPHYRVALDRGLRFALVPTVTTETAPKTSEFRDLALLSLLQGVGRFDTRQIVNMRETPLGPVSIAATTWPESPLDRLSVTLHDETAGTKPDLTFAEILRQGVEQLRDHEDVSDIVRILDVDYIVRIEGTRITIAAEVHPIALYLSALDDLKRSLAPIMRALLTPRDARFAPLFTLLEQEPDNSKIHSRLAQIALETPAAMVKGDPAVISQWGKLSDIGGRSGMPSIEILRQVLGEPGPLPDDDLVEILRERLRDDPTWRSAVGNPVFFDQIAAIPGGMSTAGITEFVDREWIEEEAARLLAELRTPHDLSAVELHRRTLLMRVIALRHPVIENAGETIDLARELPRVFESLLEGLIRSNPSLAPDPTRGREVDRARRESEPTRIKSKPKRTAGDLDLARVEPDLLRMCRDAVIRLFWTDDPTFAPAENIREVLYLTYRLHAWALQRRREVSEDVRAGSLATLRRLADLESPTFPTPLDSHLDPIRFGPTTYDFRLASFLSALSLMEDMPALARVEPRVDDEEATTTPLSRTFSTPGMLRQLRSLASRDVTPMDLEMRRLEKKDVDLLWAGPAAIPDLALLALLRLDRNQFMELDESVRERWLTAAARRDDDPRRLESNLTSLLGLFMIDFCPRFSEKERDLVETFVVNHSESSDKMIRNAVALSRVGLSLAGRHAHVRAAIDDVMQMSRTDHRLSADLAGGVVLSLIRNGSGDAVEVTRSLLAKLESVAPGAAIAAATRIGAAMLDQENDAMKDVLTYVRGLGERAPYRGRPEFEALLDFIGRSEGK